jgi:16S rRNA (uracil1498-N3)-methyltransferase
MNRFFVGHTLKEGDITHLSDKDSIFVIDVLKLDIEDIVEIENYTSIFLAIITDIQKNSVEVEIREEIEKKEKLQVSGITIIQSLSNPSKFNYFVEKSVELGIERIFPVESKYSLRSKNQAIKDFGLWRKIIKDAKEQSHTLIDTQIEKPIRIQDLQVEKDSNKICLALENIDTTTLSGYIKNINIHKPFIIAIGPEKGWSEKDINIFKQLGFSFVRLNGNILRTESVGLVIGSIIKYLKGEI